jgi:hypothetical protein
MCCFEANNQLLWCMATTHASQSDNAAPALSLIVGAVSVIC